MMGVLEFAKTITCHLPILEYAREAVMTALDNPIGGSGRARSQFAGVHYGRLH